MVVQPLPEVGEGYSVVRDFAILPWGLDLRAVVDDYVVKCRRIQRDIPTYRDPFFARSLALLETQLDLVRAQRCVLFHEDISNARVDRGHFQGFYDLEMCRLGTASMQLGVALNLCGPGKLEWAALVDGYETEVGRRLGEQDVLSALAMHHFYHWIRICRWGQWDGDPGAHYHRRASEQDAAWYLRAMRDGCDVLREAAPVSGWFRGL